MTNGATRALVRKALLPALMLGMMAGAVAAQGYPTRSITIIVPFTAGGPNDTAARVYADGLRRVLGPSASIVIENRPGAGGVPGTEAALQGEQDGHILLCGGIAPIALIPPVQKVRYDVQKDFVPLGLVWRSPQVFAANPKLGVKTVAEFVARAKASPGKITIGSAGVGTVTHLANELLRREAGIEFTHVPYRSTANSVTDLLGDHIDSIFGDIAILKPHVESGAITAMAVTSPSRSPLLPNLITTAEAGFPKVQTEVWYGMFVPARAPARVIEKLKAATLAVQKDAGVQEALHKFGINLGKDLGADGFARFLNAEYAKWTPIVTSIKK
jgi:tripartite-type tricarboxylate transporter receptor subunit TctC